MTVLLERRAFLRLGGAGAASLALSGLTPAAEKKAGKKTYTYKAVGACEIKADVYEAAGDKPRPVVMWIHGGALIVGSREGLDPGLRDRMVKAGYTVVSIDYRLAPETKLLAILEDVQDACRWVRDKGPQLFHADAGKV